MVPMSWELHGVSLPLSEAATAQSLNMRLGWRLFNSDGALLSGALTDVRGSLLMLLAAGNPTLRRSNKWDRIKETKDSSPSNRMRAGSQVSQKLALRDK
jgi:hypothetical protein